MGLGIFLLSADPDGARAAKAVLLACIPSSLIGTVLGLAGLQTSRRWGMAGTLLNGLVLLTSAGFIVATYLARLG